jgi:hypothetical protein
MTRRYLEHLWSDHIDDLALGLDDDVYHWDRDESEINERLIENIHQQTGHQYFRSGMMPVGAAANLIRSMWEYMDRKLMAEIDRLTPADH